MIKKIIFRSLLSIVLVIVLLGFIFNKNLIKLYRVATLFDKPGIADNFKHMADLIDYRTIKRAGTPSVFLRAERDIPASFMYNGAIKKSADFIDKTWTMGLLVIKGDTILYEKYYRNSNDTAHFTSWSVAKSVVSTLMGIALEEKMINNIKDPVTKYVPLLKKSGYNNVSIKDVLQMSSGIRFNEDYADFFSDINKVGRIMALGTSLDKFVVSLKSGREPGTYNHYVSMDTQVLGMVIREATKKTLSAYLEEKIWSKIGMESDAYWLVDGNGMEMAFMGLNVVLRDYGRLGMLFLNNGRYKNEHIVPATWVKESTRPEPNAPHVQPGKRDTSSWVLGYGYQWWIPENPEGDYLAIGVYGQFIYVHPKYNIVIVKNSAYPDYNKDGEEMEIESIEFFRAIARNMGGQ